MVLRRPHLLDDDNPKVFAYPRIQHELSHPIVLNRVAEDGVWAVPEEVRVPGGILALSDHETEDLLPLARGNTNHTKGESMLPNRVLLLWNGVR